MKRKLDYPEMEDPMVRPRYTGLPSFMRAPYQEDAAGLDIALIGVPFDGGVTNRPGARHGPREIRNQSSLMRRINQASGIEPYALCRIADVGDAWIEKPFELEGALREIEARRSAAPSRKACSIPSGRSRSAFGAASTTAISGASATIAACASSIWRS